MGRNREIGDIGEYYLLYRLVEEGVRSHPRAEGYHESYRHPRLYHRRLAVYGPGKDERAHIAWLAVREKAWGS